VNAPRYEVEAGMVFFASKAVRSVPERLRGFATRHYVNPLYLFTFPLLQRSVDSRLTYLIAKSLTSNIQQWRLHRAAHKSQVRGQGFLCPAAVRARNGYYQYR